MSAGTDPGLAEILDHAARTLSAAAQARATELAHERLHSRLRPFLSALSLRETPEAFELVLGRGAVWIEDGLPPADMHERLLSSPKTRVSKDGKRYLVVPFVHSRTGPDPRPIPKNSLGDALRAELRRAGVSPTKLEAGQTGPRLGTLHRLSIGSGPLAASGRPILSGAAVSQHQSGAAVGREVKTFRVISEGSPGWFHPGTAPTGVMRDTQEWVDRQWEESVLPEVVEQAFDVKLR